MKSEKIIVLIALIAVLLLSGCTQSNQNNNQNNNTNNQNSDSAANQNNLQENNADINIPFEERTDLFEESVNSIHKDFEVIRPINWLELDAQSENPFIMIHYKQDTNYEAIETEIISVIITFLPEDNALSLNAILEQGIEGSKKQMPDLKLIEEAKEVQIGSEKGLEIKFTGTAEGKKLEFKQAFTKKFNNIYTISYKCLEGKCAAYNVYNTMKNSIKFFDSRK